VLSFIPEIDSISLFAQPFVQILKLSPVGDIGVFNLLGLRILKLLSLSFGRCLGVLNIFIPIDLGFV
jgi:hypothetical protein